MYAKRYALRQAIKKALLAAGVLALVSGCGATCTGARVAPDVVLTAGHCVDVRQVDADLRLGRVWVGSQVRFQGLCSGQVHTYVTRIEGRVAYLASPVCGGDSGAPVRTLAGDLVGVLVRRTRPDSAGVVQLL